MTNKRFKFICDDEKCFFKDWNKALYCYEVVDLLNSLSDENEQLKLQMVNMEEDRDYFKSKVSSLEEGYIILQDQEIRLKKENEQLKSKNLILKGKLHQLRLKCGKQEEEIECLSEETIEKFKQDLQDGNFIEFTAR